MNIGFLPRVRLATIAAAAALTLLSACASKDPARVASAATAPLSDLNIVKPEIPPVLLAAREQPYRVAADTACEPLQAEITELDAALGPDLDAPAAAAPDLLERGTDEAKNAAIGALQRTTEGVVPLRGWVRKLSGAERQSKKVASAISAGVVRRAFLKGLRVARSCA